MLVQFKGITLNNMTTVTVSKASRQGVCSASYGSFEKGSEETHEYTPVDGCITISSQDFTTGLTVGDHITLTLSSYDDTMTDCSYDEIGVSFVDGTCDANFMNTEVIVDSSFGLVELSIDGDYAEYIKQSLNTHILSNELPTGISCVYNISISNNGIYYSTDTLLISHSVSNSINTSHTVWFLAEFDTVSNPSVTSADISIGNNLSCNITVNVTKGSVTHATFTANSSNYYLQNILLTNSHFSSSDIYRMIITSELYTEGDALLSVGDNTSSLPDGFNFKVFTKYGGSSYTVGFSNNYFICSVNTTPLTSGEPTDITKALDINSSIYIVPTKASQDVIHGSAFFCLSSENSCFDYTNIGISKYNKDSPGGIYALQDTSKLNKEISVVRGFNTPNKFVSMPETVTLASATNESASVSVDITSDIVAYGITTNLTTSGTAPSTETYIIFTPSTTDKVTYKVPLYYCDGNQVFLDIGETYTITSSAGTLTGDITVIVDNDKSIDLNLEF